MLPGRLVILGPNTWNSVARIVCSAVDPLTQSGSFNGSLSGFAAPVKSGPPLHWLFSITMRTWDAVVGGTLKSLSARAGVTGRHLTPGNASGGLVKMLAKLPGAVQFTFAGEALHA